ERGGADADEGRGKGGDGGADRARVLRRLPVPLDVRLLRGGEPHRLRPLDAGPGLGGTGPRPEVLRLPARPGRDRPPAGRRGTSPYLQLAARHLRAGPRTREARDFSYPRPLRPRGLRARLPRPGAPQLVRLRAGRGGEICHRDRRTPPHGRRRHRSPAHARQGPGREAAGL
ncbi:MAG: Ferritin, partial [uncultured Rubrobacteraceae bacterium]